MPSKKKVKKTVKFSDIVDREDGLERIVQSFKDATNAATNADAEEPEPEQDEVFKPEQDEVFKPLARSSVTAFFPLARYTSIVGVHSSLLVFTALFLPRTSLPASVTRYLHPDAAQLTLAWLCAGAAIVQGWWAGWLREWAREYEGRLESDEQRLGRKDQSWNYRKIHDLRDAWLLTLVGAASFHVVLVLFGAPIADHAPHTLLLALLLALLTVLPASYTLGPPTQLVRRLAWTRLFAEISPRTPIERALVYPTIGALLGAWSGAVPLALDWDRPWQAYPLPPAYLALLGHVLGSLAALTVNSISFLADHDRARRARFKRD